MTYGIPCFVGSPKFLYRGSQQPSICDPQPITPVHIIQSYFLYNL